MLLFLKNILQLIINPAKGWEDISHDGEEPGNLLRKGFMPLLLVCSLSCLGQLVKISQTATAAGIIEQMVVTFTVYFATLFIARFIFSATMPKIIDGEPSEKKSLTLIIYSLSIMVVIRTVINLVPVTIPILEFLPIYVAVILFKGDRYMNVAEAKIGHYMFASVLSIVAAPYLLQFAFKQLLPQL